MRAPLVACREPTGSYNRLFEVLYVFEHKTQYIALWFSGTPLEWPGKFHKSCKIWSVSMHHSLQIMFILPLMPGHLFWKATFFLGGFYRGVPLYFDISVICPHRFRIVKFVIIPHDLDNSNICEILLYKRQLVVIMYELIYVVPAAHRLGKVIVKRDYQKWHCSLQLYSENHVG